MSVALRTGAEISVERPAVLFRAAFAGGHELVQSYDVMPDDRAFVMIRAVGGSEKSRINVIQNWFDELNAKVPR